MKRSHRPLTASCAAVCAAALPLATTGCISEAATAAALKNMDCDRFEAAIRGGGQAVSADHPAKPLGSEQAFQISDGAPARCFFAAPPVYSPQLLEQVGH